MKKSLFLVLAIACSLIANAAEKETKFFVGGTVGLTHSTINIGEGKYGVDFSGTSFKLIPEFGYQINKKFAVGLSLGYVKGYSALGSLDMTDFKALGNAVASTAMDVLSDKTLLNLNASAFRFAPYSRYTVVSLGKFEFFVDGVLGFNFGSIKAVNPVGEADADDDATIKDSFTTVEISFKPGVAFNINKHVQILAKIGSLGFQHMSLKDYKVSINRFGFDFDSGNLLLGATYRF